MRALLFAAGEGRRMRPLTQILPKPLIEVGGVPMAVRQILALRKAGITEIVVNAAHGARILMAELGDGRSLGVKLLWSVEGFTAEDALETRGGIVRALPLLGSGPFIAVAGDIVTDFDYSALVRRAGTLSSGAHSRISFWCPIRGFTRRATSVSRTEKFAGREKNSLFRVLLFTIPRCLKAFRTSARSFSPG